MALSGPVLRAVEHAAGTAELLVSALPGSADVRRQASASRETAHRPWPLPRGPWLMGQTWRDLLFAHWPVREDAMRAVVPAPVPVDTREGWAWLGVTPFEVTGLRLRGLPSPPLLGRFAEVNVRTYATIDGRPGIYFFSLDAASLAAVIGAREAYRLPYFRAAISLGRAGGRVAYRARRLAPAGEAAELAVDYAPAGAPFRAAPGSLEHFLTERYCLYTLDRRGALHTADIHHRPWPLQPAQAELRAETLSSSHGIRREDRPPLLHFSARQDVVVWPLRPLTRR